MDIVLGVDGGNTKTIALAASPDGTILGAGRAGCSDIYGATSPESALEELSRAVDAALTQAGCSRESINTACLSLAGADWDEDYAYLQAAVERLGLGRRATIYNDAIGALRAGSPDGTGVIIACGTGIATAARNSAGVFWHTSFWQEELCGLELGRQTLRVIVRSELGIDPPTSLTAPTLAQFSQPTVEALLHHRTRHGGTPLSTIQISKLAPILLDEAEKGDPMALSIATRHGVLLAEYALAAARKVGIDSTIFNLVLNGGVFRHKGRVLVDAITRYLEQHAPGVVPLRSTYEPAVGALLLALEAADIVVDDAVLDNLNRTLPDHSLFAT